MFFLKAVFICLSSNFAVEFFNILHHVISFGGHQYMVIN